MGSAVWRRESSERVSCVKLVAERGLQAAAASLPLPAAEYCIAWRGRRQRCGGRERREGGRWSVCVWELVLRSTAPAHTKQFFTSKKVVGA
jgi:hypothetical protein